MDARYKRFVLTLVLAMLVGLAAVAALNVLVDSPGAYPGLHLRGLEPQRRLKYDRVHKAEMARFGDWEFIILGSSRAKAGFPADFPAFQTNRTLNLGMDGVRFAEIVGAFEFARQRNPIRHVLLALDFYLFAPGEDPILDYPESRFNPTFDRVSYYGKQLLGQAAIAESWEAIRHHWKHENPGLQSRNGFYDHHLGATTSQRQLFDQVLRAALPGVSRQTLSPAVLEQFRRMVRECRDGQIDLQIVLMPVHALELECIHAGGNWATYVAWKSDLVRVIADEGMQGTVGLWDFTGFSGPPAETVPPAGDAKTRMTYFYENSHCTPVFGRLMLEAIYGPPGAARFGVRLDGANLAAHQARMLKDRDTYAEQNPAEIRWVHGMF
jgi:hypothetical protein